MDQLLAEFVRRTQKEWEHCQQVTGQTTYGGHPRQIQLAEQMFNQWPRIREALAEKS